MPASSGLLAIGRGAPVRPTPEARAAHSRASLSAPRSGRHASDADRAPSRPGITSCPAVPFYALAGAAMLRRPRSTAIADRLDTATPGDRARVFHERARSAVGTVVAALSPALGPRSRAARRTSTRSTDVVPRGCRRSASAPESNGDWGLHAWFERRFAREPRRRRAASERQWFLEERHAHDRGVQPAGCRAPSTDPTRDAGPDDSVTNTRESESEPPYNRHRPHSMIGHLYEHHRELLCSPRPPLSLASCRA